MISSLPFRTSGAAERLQVTVDPRIELLSVVLKLSGYGDRYAGRLNTSPSSYLTSVETYFKTCIAHPTVQYFQDINRQISGDLPVAIVLYLSYPPALTLQAPFDAVIQARAADTRLLEQYVQALRAFAVDTRFADFFKAQAAYYASIIAAPDRAIRAGHYVEALEDYFGRQQHSYQVIFAPGLKSIAFGPRVHRADGELDVYCVFPAVEVAQAVIKFKTGRGLRNAILHEFAHSFVNPLVDRYQSALLDYADLMQHVQYATGANYGSDWLICVYEHLVRAVTTRLTGAEFGADAGEQELLAHEQQGFRYLRPLCDRLASYEQHRTAYPTFEAFFPELIAVFSAQQSSLETTAGN